MILYYDWQRLEPLIWILHFQFGCKVTRRYRKTRIVKRKVGRSRFEHLSVQAYQPRGFHHWATPAYSSLEIDVFFLCLLHVCFSPCSLHLCMYLEYSQSCVCVICDPTARNESHWYSNHNTECNDFRSAGQKHWFLVFIKIGCLRHYSVRKHDFWWSKVMFYDSFRHFKL